jgi:hypothetical protein
MAEASEERTEILYVRGRVDEILRLLGKLEPLLEDVPKLRDKLQTLEIKVAQLETEVAEIKLQRKEERLKALLGTVLTSGAVAGIAGIAQYIVK